VLWDCFTTSANEIKSIINSLKSKNLCSYDEISTTLHKSCTNYTSFPLIYLCNQSMAVVFPEQRKYLKVKPLHKNGEKSFISNCRQISLLSILSEVFEKVMYKSIKNKLHFLAYKLTT
jgi:hypothetical protein